MFTHPVGKTVKYTGAVFEAGKKIATRVSLELVFLLAYIFLPSSFFLISVLNYRKPSFSQRNTALYAISEHCIITPHLPEVEIYR